MKNLFMTLAALCFLAVTSGCTTMVPRPAAQDGGPFPDITIIVDQSEDHTHYVHGVRVSAVLATGEIQEIGRVASGSITLSKQHLRDIRTQILLFHGGDYFTGAIRVFDPEVRFYEFHEYHIALAPFHIH